MAVSVNEVAAMVARMRRQGADDAGCEAKACERRLSSDVWESVSAFANTSGGVLLLGIDERSGFVPARGFDAGRVRDQFIEGIGDGGVDGARLTLPPEYELSRVDFEGAQVLAVRVRENPVDKKPCFVTAKGVEGGSYKRVDDKDIRLSAMEVYELRNALTPSMADMGVVAEADLSDLDGGIVDGIVERSRRSGSRALRGARTDAERLARLKIADRHGGVRLGGLLVAGKYPQQFLPRLFVDVAAHPGTGKAPAGGRRFLDRAQCEGPMPEMVDAAVEAVARNLRTFSLVEGTGRRDELEIPREVLREAVANAVIHREYHARFLGQPVSVDVYSDRVVVSNPGGLWGGKTLGNLDDGESRCRNGALVQLMQQASPRGAGGATVEGQGTGVIFMINEMRSRALPLPDFEASPDRFRVTLWRGGAQIDENRRWIGEHAGGGLPRRQEVVLMAARSGVSTVAGMRDRLGYDSDDVRAIVEALSARGLLRVVAPDTFVPAGRAVPGPVVSRAPGAAGGTDAAVLALVPVGDTVSAREIAEGTGKSLETVRRSLRRLAGLGLVVPTDGPRSRRRRYTRPQAGPGDDAGGLE